MDIKEKIEKMDIEIKEILDRIRTCKYNGREELLALERRKEELIMQKFRLGFY